MSHDKDVVTFELTLENMQVFMTVQNAVQRACPFCTAKPQRGCTTLGGKKRKTFHLQRMKAK